MHKMTQYKIMAIEAEHDKEFWPLLRELMSKGFSRRKIYAYLPYHRHSLNDLIRHHGPSDVRQKWKEIRQDSHASPQKRKIEPSDYPVILGLKEAGVRTVDIAEKYEVCISSVSRALRNARIERAAA